MKTRRLIFLLATIFICFWFLGFARRPTSGCFVIYGDTRTNHAVHKQIVKAIIKIKPKAIFNTGDLVEDGLNPKDWIRFNRITARLRGFAPYYPALGNHDRESPLFFSNFNLPNNERWYSIEEDGIHFIILDSNLDLGIDSEQYRWLESDLKNRSNKVKFTVVIFHHPLFSSSHDTEDEKKLRPVLLPLFEKYNVDIVFCGHSHNYERSMYNGIYYIVTGGGGGLLHDKVRTNFYSQLFFKIHHFCQLCIINDELVVKVFDINLKLIDEFKLLRKNALFNLRP